MRWCHTFQVAMRDGIRLGTDVYLPGPTRGVRRFPVVLMRGPYGRGELVSCFPAIASVLSEHGYAVVAQDVRGRYASEGVAAPFSAMELGDSYDTLDWVDAQPWSAGSVIAMGDSYNGWLAWAAAAVRHPSLQAIVPGVTSTRVGGDWMYDSGAFCLSTMLDWATVAWSGRENRFPEFDWTVRPLGELVSSWLGGTSVADAFSQWISRPADSRFWQSGVFREVRADRIQVPGLHLGGWWDFFRRGVLADWRSARKATARQYLVMSCSDHHHVPLRPDPWLGTADEDDLVFAQRYGAMVLPFLDFVTGRSPRPQASAVRYQVAHAGWRESDSWPPPGLGRLPLYLVDGSRSVADIHGGGLSWRAARAAKHVAWLHGPESPVPSTERDPFAMLVKPVDERRVQGRNDVLTFTTPPLDRPLDLIAASELRLRVGVSSGRQFAAKLSDVFLDGRAFRITEGVCTLAHSPADETVTVSFRPCAYRIRAGHSLRLEIAASHFPRYLPAADNPWKDLGGPVSYDIVVGGVDGSLLDLTIGTVS